MLNAEQHQKQAAIDPANQQRFADAMNEACKALDRMATAATDAALALHLLTLQIQIQQFKARRDADQAQTTPGASA